MRGGRLATRHPQERRTCGTASPPKMGEQKRDAHFPARFPGKVWEWTDAAAEAYAYLAVSLVAAA